MKKLFLLSFVLGFSFALYAQVSKTVNLNSSGSLSTLLTSEELKTITNLTLSGSIDSRDFKTMRDEMPVLSSIDISGVNILAYSGALGTGGSDITTYQANSIPDRAFYYVATNTGKLSLTSVTLSSSVISLGVSAFDGCKGLSSLTIPSSVITLSDWALYNCAGLPSVFIPKSTISIGKGTFTYTGGLITADPDNPSYSSIDGVLYNKNQSTLIQCPTIKSGNYTIPSSVTSISDFAFTGTGLTSISVPSSVTTIGGQAFYFCDGLIQMDGSNPNYSSIDGILFNKNQSVILECPTSKTGSYTIPSTVATINSSAFQGCNKLTSMTIPFSVVLIGGAAFSGCYSLNAVYVYSNIPIDLSNSDYVFYNVNKNTCTLYVPYGSYGVYHNALTWQNFSTIVEMSGYKFSANAINVGAPQGSTNSVDVFSDISWTVSSDQSWLVVSPTSGTGGQTLFFTAEENSLLTKRTATVTISSNGIESRSLLVTQNGQPQPPRTMAITAGGLSSAFTAEELTSITSLTLTGTIDARDFKTMRDDMPALSNIDLSGAIIAEYTGTLGTNGSDNLIYPANGIPDQAFHFTNTNEGKLTLNSVVLSSSVTSFGASAFDGCTGLTEFSLPSATVSIEDWAFYNCSGLFSLNIPKSTTFIGTGTFMYAGGTISVDANNPNYSSVEGVLFNKTQDVLIDFPTIKTGNYTIPSTVSCVSDFAFSGSGLTSVSIPASVISISSPAFYLSRGIFIVDENNPNYSSIDGILFNKTRTTLLECPISISGSYTIPSSVTSVENGAFQGCGRITSVTIPSSVTSIGPSALICKNLSSIYSYSNIPIDLSNSDYVFYSVNKNSCILYVPYGSSGLYASASHWKDFVNIVEMPSFMLSTTIASVEAAQGSTVAIEISSSVSWTASSDQTWLVVSPISGIGAQTLTFTADANQLGSSRTANVTISPTGADSQTVTITQNTITPNQEPIANAGEYRNVYESEIVTLDGRLSSDPEGDPITYLWTEAAGITLSSTTVGTPSFTAPAVIRDTPFTFSLIVNDGKINSKISQVVITVKQALSALKLISRINNSSIPVSEVNYQLFLKSGNSFIEKNISPKVDGDTTKFSVGAGEWIVFVSPSLNSSAFIPTYVGNALDWNNAERIIISDNGYVFREIDCIVPEIPSSGSGEISGYIYENPEVTTKRISIAEAPFDNNNPMARVLVKLLKRGETVPVSTTFTDATGFYKFDQLELTDYNISIEIPGFTQSEDFGISLSNDKPLATAYFEVNTTSLLITDNSPQRSTLLKIYPNPVIRSLTIDLERNNNKPSWIFVYNILGELLVKRETTSTKTILDFSKLATGTYLVKVWTGKESQSTFILKK